MGFPENLMRLRKERHLSQEELAELLEVSRQAVSKWEQGMGYPEVEKLLQISDKMSVSLDSLMFDDDVNPDSERPLSVRRSGEILIRSPHENVIASCSKVGTTDKMGGSKHSPHYALFGSDGNCSCFGAENRTFLAWYADYESISKEVEEIYSAILRGDADYTLQYSVRTERRGMSVRMVP